MLQISRRSTRLLCAVVFPSSGAIFDLDGIKKEVAGLDEKMSAADFWDNPDQARALMEKVNPLKKRLEAFLALESRLDDLDVLIELGGEGDVEMSHEAVREYEAWQI